MLPGFLIEDPRSLMAAGVFTLRALLAKDLDAQGDSGLAEFIIQGGQRQSSPQRKIEVGCVVARQGS